MNAYFRIQEELIKHPRTWLITGAAGFVGSNIVEKLLQLGQTVIGLDNFSNGYRENIEEIKRLLHLQSKNFHFTEGDIRNLDTCRECCRDVDIVLHQAALGSVPRSIVDPIATNQSNIDGTLNMLVAAKDEKVKRFVYASSSSVYGDEPQLPKIEENTGIPMSPYAVSKKTGELYARVFECTYELKTVILRYFNVFGPRQNPDNPYAAVIPNWFKGLLLGEPIYIYGDGETSRDFCYIENTVQANILAGCTDRQEAIGQIFNISFSERTTLNELFYIIRDLVSLAKPEVLKIEPIYKEFRPGDVRHSLANINKAKSLLGYEPSHSVFKGLKEASSWYIQYFNKM